MSELSGYMFHVGDDVLTGDNEVPHGRILAIEEKLGEGKALIASNPYDVALLQLGFPAEDIARVSNRIGKNPCKWVSMANLMPDEGSE